MTLARFPFLLILLCLCLPGCVVMQPQPEPAKAPLASATPVALQGPPVPTPAPYQVIDGSLPVDYSHDPDHAIFYLERGRGKLGSDAWQVVPDMVLYGDGRVIYSRATPTQTLLYDAHLPQTDLDRFMASLKDSGFLFLANLYGGPEDSGTSTVYVDGLHQSKSFRIVGGDNQHPAITPDAYRKIVEYSQSLAPAGASLYQPDRYAVTVAEVAMTPSISGTTIPNWPVREIDLAKFIDERGNQARLRTAEQEIDAQTADALRPVLDKGLNGKYFTYNGHIYSIGLRPYLPGEEIRPINYDANDYQISFAAPATAPPAMPDQSYSTISVSKEYAFKGHRRTVNAVVFSRDGKLMASGSADRTARIWDLASGKQTQNITLGAFAIALAFSPDSKLLATAALSPTVRLWDTTTGKLQAELDLGLSPDSVLAAAQPALDTPSYPQAISVAFTPDGKYLAAGYYDGLLVLWRLSDNTPLIKLHRHTDSVTAIAFSQDGKTMATGSADNSIMLWHFENDEAMLTHILRGHWGRIYTLDFSPDGASLVSASLDRSVAFWDAGSGKLQASYTWFDGWAGAAMYSPDGRYLLAGGNNGVRLIDLRAGKGAAEHPLLVGAPLFSASTVAWHPNGVFAIGGNGMESDDTDIRIWSIRRASN